MTSVVFLVEQTAVALYILIGVGILIAFYSLLRSQGAYRATYFELERDIARYHRANALTVLIILVEIALVVVGIQRVVAPHLRKATTTSFTFERVTSDGVFITPTPFALEGGAPIDPSGVQLEEEDPAQRVLATPTLTPTPVGTILPNAPEPIGCDTPNAWLQIPANGMVVFEPISVVGGAFVDNFAFYRFEINGPSTFGNFAAIRDYNLPVTERGELGQFVPGFYEPGEYQFRVSVVDATNIVMASCTVTIYISDPIPTPTPLGADLGPNQIPNLAATPPAGA